MYFAGAAFRFIDNAMMPRGRRHESRRRSLHGPLDCLEYNFIGPVGQLGARDGWVSNIGSLLDPTTAGVHVPE
jgi:hypothetical protein